MRSINRRQAPLGSVAIAAAPALLQSRPAHAAEVTCKFGTNVPAAHPLNARAQEACDRILITGYLIALFIGLVVVTAVPWISIGFL